MSGRESGRSWRGSSGWWGGSLTLTGLTRLRTWSASELDGRSCWPPRQRRESALAGPQYSRSFPSRRKR
eukprot:1952675-Pyramimonas_sp.AAC.1